MKISFSKAEKELFYEIILTYFEDHMKTEEAPLLVSIAHKLGYRDLAEDIATR